ncbi:MAG: hypothetical protein ACK5PE_02020 [bacterium]|nr:hypothetical protein [Curvibacter sp.]
MALIIWAHWAAQPAEHLWAWAVSADVVLSFRVGVAQLYLAKPQAQLGRVRQWLE